MRFAAGGAGLPKKRGEGPQNAAREALLSQSASRNVLKGQVLYRRKAVRRTEIVSTGSAGRAGVSSSAGNIPYAKERP